MHTAEPTLKIELAIAHKDKMTQQLDLIVVLMI